MFLGIKVLYHIFNKVNLNFEAKSWWIMVHYRLGLTVGYNILSPNRAALVVNIV